MTSTPLRFVNSQLVCLLPVGILKCVVFKYLFQICLCGRRIAGENFKHRIAVHVQLYYDDSLTVRWESENKIYDYKLYTVRRYTENAKIHARKKFSGQKLETFVAARSSYTLELTWQKYIIKSYLNLNSRPIAMSQWDSKCKV